MSFLLDPQLDSYTGDFEDYRRMVNAKALRLGVLITVAVQVPFLLFEWLALGEQFWWVQLIRVLWLGPTVALYALLTTPSDRLLRHVDGIIWFIYVASAAFVVVVSFLHAGYQSPYIHGLILMFVGVGAVTLWHLGFALFFTAAVYGAYWMPLLLGYGSIENVTSWIGYQCFLIGTIGIVLVSQQLRLQMAQADFRRRCQLEEEKAQTRELLERVAFMRQERLTWLESLARFLRHELKNQMVAMGTSLDLVEQTPPAAPPERYLNRARRSLAQMNRLVQSATEATSLEAALAVESSERLDLSGIVGEQVLLFRQANPGRAFRADIEPGLEIKGQDNRIAQLLDKLLENALEHGAQGSDINVTLRHDGDSILLSVENHGDPLPPNKEALFDAFVTARKNGDGGHNLGLGLYVAKAIAQSHSGDIRACDIDGALGARFEVRFPSEVR
jgi:signal transduction histidine kinase